jgi:MFS family permease
MLWFVCFFNYADRQSIFSVFPSLQQEFGFDKFQLGLIGSAFMWVYAASAPFAGYLGDRLQRKTLILGGFIFWSVVTMATAWATQFRHFFAIRALEGFGEAFYFPASMSLLSDYHGPRTRSRAMSFHQSSVYIGTIGGGVLGGLFAEHYGWRNGFYFFGGGGILLALILMRFLREPERGAADALPEPQPAGAQLGLGEVVREIFRTPTAIVLMLGFVGANFVAMTFLTWMPTFLREKFDLKLTLAGLAGTLFIQLASAVGAPFGGILADRWFKTRPGGRMQVQALGLFLGASFIFLTGYTRDVKALMLWMTIFGFCKGLYDANIFASLYDFVRPQARASAAGVLNAVGWTGGALAPVTIGWILTRGGADREVANMSQAIAFGGFIYLAVALLLLTASVTWARRDLISAPTAGNQRS